MMWRGVRVGRVASRPQCRHVTTTVSTWREPLRRSRREGASASTSSSINSRTPPGSATRSSASRGPRGLRRDLGRADGSTDIGPLTTLTTRELDVLATGFTTIRDREPLDDVTNWANAVIALIEDAIANQPPATSVL